MPNTTNINNQINTMRRLLIRWSHAAIELAISSDAPVHTDRSIKDGFSVRTNLDNKCRQSKGGIERGRGFVDYALMAAMNEQQNDGTYLYSENSSLPNYLQDIYTTIEIYTACLAAHETAHACIFYQDNIEKRPDSPDHGPRWQVLNAYLRKALVKRGIELLVQNSEKSGTSPSQS
ncbi:hypothetical protein [Vibrio fluvialis]|uniref:hypothetical protein n=1 Tax=Vibrio fluvialis TaxID=676 RepID=UPI0023A9F447|nr:hypothetical protein [Vibrio fluvialis]MDE5179129.1 hypothetical protein [Vibrio fluvialis]